MAENNTCHDCNFHATMDRFHSVEESMPGTIHTCIEHMEYWVEDQHCAVDCTSWEPNGSAQ